MRTKTDDRPERRDGIGIRRASFPLPKHAPDDGRAARCHAPSDEASYRPIDICTA